MEFIVKSRNGKVTQHEQEYIKEKIGKLERYLDLISKVTVEVGEAQRRSQGNMHRAQVTLVGDHGILLRAEEYPPDLNSAIDRCTII